MSATENRIKAVTHRMRVLQFAPIILLWLLLSACHRQQLQQPKVQGGESQPISATQALPVTPSVAATFRANSPVTCILQDRGGVYWFGTDRDGVYRYDGKSILRLDEQAGLCNNQVRRIYEDLSSGIWIATANGVCRYDGLSFTNFPLFDDANLGGHLEKQWQKSADDFWFPVGGGVFRYHPVAAYMTVPSTFTYLPLPSTERQLNYSESPSSPVGPFTVYSTLKDQQGNLWMGTQSLGVCRYDGSSFTWFADKGLSGPAVLAIFQDKAGNLWFGNNGAGVFRYDGASLSNFTEEHGLSNPDFLKSSGISTKPGLGTLARIYAIGEDNAGNIWFGTIDAGAWRYDGKSLKNFTKRDGLDSDTIQCIYQDRNKELLFGTDGGSVYRFDGNAFVPFIAE